METKKRGRPAKVRNEIQANESEPEIYRLLVISKYPNPSWVKGIDEKRNKVEIKIPKTIKPEKLLNKWVNATKRNGEESNRYNLLP